MNLTAFQYSDKEIRTIVIDNEPWFVAKDICQALGVSNSRDALTRLHEKEKGVSLIDTLGGKQELAVVSESGMYALVLRSRKPEAEPFRLWVTSEVLPSIRKTGTYAIAKEESKLALPETYIEALEALVKSEKDKLILQAENEMLEADNLVLSEAVDELNSYSSIVRVAKFNHVNEKTFRWQSLKAMSMKMGIEVKKVPCPRFLTKNLYHHDVWRYLYPDAHLPETTTAILVAAK